MIGRLSLIILYIRLMHNQLQNRRLYDARTVTTLILMITTVLLLDARCDQMDFVVVQSGGMAKWTHYLVLYWAHTLDSLCSLYWWQIMTEQEAKNIIRNDPEGDVKKRLEAIEKALEVIGSNATMADIWRWVDNDKDTSGTIKA